MLLVSNFIGKDRENWFGEYIYMGDCKSVVGDVVISIFFWV